MRHLPSSLKLSSAQVLVVRCRPQLSVESSSREGFGVGQTSGKPPWLPTLTGALSVTPARAISLAGSGVFPIDVAAVEGHTALGGSACVVAAHVVCWGRPSGSGKGVTANSRWDASTPGRMAGAMLAALGRGPLQDPGRAAVLAGISRESLALPDGGSRPVAPGKDAVEGPSRDSVLAAPRRGSPEKPGRGSVQVAQGRSAMEDPGRGSVLEDACHDAWCRGTERATVSFSDDRT